VTSADIVNGQVYSSDIADVTIGASDIADSAITSSKLAGGAVKPNVHVVKGSYVTIAPSGFGTAYVDCPGREILTGGRFDNGAQFRVTTSMPGDQNTWFVQGVNEDRVASSYMYPCGLCIGVFP
jgi:hypothetical protein